MSMLETSPLVLQNDGNEESIARKDDSLRHWRISSRKLLFIVSAPLGICWMMLQNSRASLPEMGQQGRHTESSRFDVDHFIHAFESENTQQLSLLHHHHIDYHYEEGKLDHLFYFNRTSAYENLVTNKESSAQDFYNYVQGGWEAQINQGYCGIAASAAILNSLGNHISLPQDPTYIPYPWATQFQVIRDGCVKETVYDVDDPNTLWVGLSLEMAVRVLNCHLSYQGYVAEAYHVNPATFSKWKMRRLISEAVLDKKSRVMINYDRGGIGQGSMGHGHFSPIGAYNAELDAFLIMDVAKYKYPPVWVPTSNLFYGVGSSDFCASFQYPEDPSSIDLATLTNYTAIGIALRCQPDYRGFIVVKPKE
eukprot:scaffold1184_cov132-Cylindrotheca_fusiformis.AAC.91